ncbi:beta strand repeat-containing protein [Methanobrevibacter sp.]|uniref:beta strand repeat-containing protein n=1 Tax=Methanobrevibacter sp. TaxID=66852 RepID=UPI0038638614
MKRQIKVISLLLLIFFVSLSFVSASDSDGLMLTDDSGTADGYYTLNSTGNDGTGVNTPISSNDGNQNNPTGESNSKTFSDLRNAINSADEGSTLILYDDYAYDSGVTFDGIKIGKQITIDGNGHTLDGKNSARMFHIDADNVVLRNINFVNGNPNNNGGGALLIRASNTLIENCTFTSNKGGYGGAIFMNKEYNSKLVAGTTILYCEFSDNTAESGGGAIYSESKENSIVNNKFTNNKANTGLGGAVFISGSDNEILNNVFTSNKAQQNDGGALSINEASNQLIANNTFTKNTGKNGGAVNLYYAGGYTVINNIFDENTATDTGGAMRLSIKSTASVSEIANNTFKNNKATHGGALSSDSEMAKYTQNIFTNNEATGPGGAINLNGKSNEISFNVIEECSASTYGGAIYFVGDSNKILNNYISNCHSGLNGGAIYIEGASATISNNNIKSNDAKNYGGAITIAGASATIKNNIISDNSANEYDGGALYINGNSAVISGNTFTSNNAKKYGGAIKNDKTSTTINSNIFKGNTASRGLAIANNAGGLQFTNNVFIGAKSSDSTVWLYIAPSSNKDNIYTGDGQTYTKISTAITSSDVVADYNSDEMIVAALKDAYGTAMCDVNVEISVGNIKEILTTDEYGEASLSTNGLNPGTYTAVISYAGSDIYASSKKSIKVTINKFDSKLISQDVTVDYGDENGELTAGLFDDAAGIPIAGADVVFNIDGKTSTVKTDSAGQAKVSTADLAPGNYTAIISFNGNTMYKEASTSANIAVTNIPTSIDAVYDVDARELTATLINNVTGQALGEGNDLVFTIAGESRSAKTDANGQAKVSVADLAPGTYTATISFEGDVGYKASSTTADVFIKDNVVLSAVYDDGILTATLIDNVTGQAIGGADLTVSFSGKNYTVKTNSNGQATVPVTGLAPGTNTIAVYYGGSSTYNPAEASVEVFVKADTTISLVYNSAARKLVATLTNNATGDSVKGANVVFTIKTKSYNVKTDLNGQAKLITLNLGLGENTATATYNGNVKYNPSTTTINFTNRVNTALLAVYNDAAEEVVVTLIDNDTGKTLARGNIIVKLAGITYKGKTDAKGQFRVSTADLAPGTYTATVTYKGTIKYTPSQTSVKVPLQTATCLSAVYNANTNQIIATLTDNATGQAIVGGNIIFDVNGTDYIAKTNSLGQAKISTKDWAYGTYTADVDYEGNSKYTASSASTTFTVKIATIISANYDADTMEVIATLINEVTIQPILGATVTIKINKVTYKVSTDNSGQARLSVADFPLGTYDAVISYGGNSKYNPTSTSLSVPVKANTSLDVAYDADAKQFITTLTNDINGEPVSGVDVNVELNGASYTLKTNSNGQVSVSTAGFAPNVYPASVSFVGDSRYNPADASMDVIIDVDTKVSAVYKDGILTATLVNNATGNGINGAELLVSFGDVNYTVKTDSNGQAIVSTRDLAPGPYTAVVSFDGNGGSPSSTSIDIDVKTDGFFIVEDISVEYGSDVNLVANLINYATGKGIVGATVGFKFNGKSYSAKTDSNGQAKVTISGLNPGNYETTVTYNGNTKYNPAKATFNALVNKITTSFDLYYDSQTNEVVATLINGATGKGVYGGTVGIFLNNVKNIIVTDKNGQARLSLGNVDPTTFTAYASYAGNTKYFATGRTITPVENKVISCISAEYNKESDEVVATLINTETDKPIVGGTVSVVVNNVRNTLKTDSNGQAKVSLADKVPNVYVVVSSYSGNNKYTATTETRSIVKI